jgi:hypothetical protein
MKAFLKMHTIKATVTFADTGNTIKKTALDGLPIVGEEKVKLKFTDNNEMTLDLTLYVNKVTPLSLMILQSLWFNLI